MAITFDDGPDAASTPTVLAELDRLGWTATFFVLGEMVRKDPGVLRAIVDSGHEVGVHGDRHRSHLLMAPWQVRADLIRATTTIGEVTGSPPRWFRPPYGELSIGSLSACRALELKPVLWSVWGRDWEEGATPESVAATVLAGLSPGGTVLLHDSDCKSAPGSWRATLGSLSLIAHGLDPTLAVGPLREHFQSPEKIRSICQLEG